MPRIYFYVIMESDDFKTALEVVLQFFPGIKLKRENRNCASKASLSNEKTSSSGFCRLGISDWLFHRRALSIGQKTELSLLRVFVELLQLHFHKCCSKATLIDSIFVNNPEQVHLSGNLITDLSDHFAQFCIMKSVREKPTKFQKTKVRDYSQFSADCFNYDLSQVKWNNIISSATNDIDKMFSSFYNELNKILNNHAPIKTLLRCKAKQCYKPWIT